MDVKVEEVLSSKEYVHIDLLIDDLKLNSGPRKAKFKLIVTSKFTGLEFRSGSGWPKMFLNWPGREQDAHGEKFLLGMDSELPAELRQLGSHDLEFLTSLVEALPEIVTTALRGPGYPLDVSLLLTAAADAFCEEFRASAGVPAAPSAPAPSAPVVQAAVAANDIPTADTAASGVPGRPLDALIRTQLATARLLHPGTRGDPPERLYAEHPRAELGLAGIMLQCNNDDDRGAVSSVVVGEAIRLAFASVSGWIRLLSPLHRAGHFLHQRLWSVEIQLHATAAAVTAVAAGVGYFDRDGAFCVAHAFCRNRTVSEATPPLKFVVLHADLKQLLREVDDGLALFLFVEFDRPGELEFAPPVLRDGDPDGISIPYHRSGQPSCEHLRWLNGEMFRHIETKTRLHWLVDEADLAYRVECLETAAALARLIAPHCRQLEPSQRNRFLCVFVDTGFAEARRADVADMLILNFDQTRTDDHLFTALSLCQPPGQRGEMFRRLPSGKLNRAWLSSDLAAPQGLELLAEAAIEDADGQLQLLAASQLRVASPRLYLTALNDFLARHQLTLLRAASPGGTNVLASFRFAAVPPRPDGPKVSVIMAVCNAAATVSYAIRSVLEQSHQELELLVCDDGSTDDSAAEIEKWRHDSRVRIFRSLANQGTYNIRNSLIPEASGTYVTFQDADDISHPQRLHIQVEKLQTSEVAAVFGQWIRFRPDGTIVFFRDHRCLRMCVVSLMAKKELFEEFNGYRSVLCGADSDFLERVRLELGPDAVTEIGRPLLFGLWSAQSLTRQPGLEVGEHGFMARSRRRFAEIAGRQRLLGRSIVPDQVVEDVAREVGIHRPCCGVVSVPPTDHSADGWPGDGRP